MTVEIPKYLTSSGKKVQTPLLGHKFLQKLVDVGILHTTDMVHGVTVHAEVDGIVQITVHRFADESLLEAISET